ncbi:MFS general substrate transporter [Panaeolus papilionaceus]|nr:MFS general substrate transporter [Panaeolus papilionaceus]
MKFLTSKSNKQPAGLTWRASSWFVTFVIGLGIAVDLLVYSIIIPVMPFQLEALGYDNISSRTSWLLFAWVMLIVSLFLATIPIAMISERYNARQSPLVVGLFILIGAQIMLMEAPNYAVMCMARVLLGIGSSMVWVVGLALLCDTAPPSIIGLQLGLAMCGFSLGLVVGPPVGGALYDHFGFRGPFIFGLIATFLDLIGRLLIIERKDALQWVSEPVTASSPTVDSKEDHPASPTTTTVPDSATATPTPPLKSLSLLAVIIKLAKSSRALMALSIVFIHGVLYSCQEPTIPLHLQSVWGLNSSKVGLVFVAAVLPTLISSPLGGHLADKRGVEWVTVFCLILAVPWWILLILEVHLALFIVSFAVQSFFISSILTPVTAELASVANSIEGVGYAHVYGAFNFAYGIVGPIIGGQIYDHVNRGWMVICVISACILVLFCGLSACFTGQNPLLRRLKRSRQTTAAVSP